MARNEEKQLARLNRLYLQQQKEEELKKRPPRPKLTALSTVEDIKKWIPTIVRDIDFYVKQMEVTCYPQRQIEEFELRIDRLRGEYKAFIRKMHQLEPDLKTTPWGDHPYTGKRRKMDAHLCSESKNDDGKDSGSQEDTQQNDKSDQKTFIPLCTPVLKNSSLCQAWYGFEKPKVPNVQESEIQMQDEPLQFEPGNILSECTKLKTSIEAVKWTESGSRFNLDECNTQRLGTVGCCCESSVHCHGDGHQANVSGNLTEANMATTLLHHKTSHSKCPEKCSLNTIPLHTKTENERFTGQHAYGYSVHIEKTSVQERCASSLNDNSSLNDKSGVSVLGSLNIPYTDSSSSETET